jgi:hypothetical protein
MAFALGACNGPPDAEAARSPFDVLAADSLAADSAAFDELPPRLTPWLDVREYVSAEQLLALPPAACDELPEGAPSERRVRLRLRLPDTSTVVLYAVADREHGTLERVELIRRIPNQGQRGFIWSATRDRAEAAWWVDPPWGRLGRGPRVERGEIPRSSPVPRALRALGRQLNTLPCNITAVSPP